MTREEDKDADYWRKYREEHKEQMASARKEKWRNDEEWRGKHKQANLKSYRRYRRKVFEMLGGVKCSWDGCKCVDERILEIDHESQEGGKERRELGRSKSSYNVAWEVYVGRRSTEGLRVLCRMHNALAWIEWKYPDLKGKIEVGYAN